MTINTNWQIKVGTFDAPVDFTSRVFNMSIKQNCGVNRFGRGTASFSLYNNDGALTPGGGGTYSSTDWFAQGVFISALTNTGGANTTTAVFHGVVSDFELDDNGVFSTVTITARDGFSISGQTSFGDLTAYGEVTLGQALDVALNGFAGYTVDIQYPRLGKTNDYAQYYDRGGTSVNSLSDSTVSNVTFADIWEKILLPTANAIAWPTTINSVILNTIQYELNVIFRNMTRTAANSVNFIFDQGTLGANELPFTNFQQGFTNNEVVTAATYKGLYTGASSVTTINNTASAKYGPRSVSFNSTTSTNATNVTSLADEMVNRYSTARFIPDRLSLTASQVRSKALDSAHSYWYNLLSINIGLWQKASVTWTGKGAIVQTADLIIDGRVITVTPEDTIITLSFQSWTDNHSFILNTDKLDIDRLG